MPYVFHKLCLLCIVFICSANLVFAQKNKRTLEQEAAKQFEIGHYGDALKTRLELLRIAEKSNDGREIAFALWQLGRMQYFVMDVSGALKTNLLAKHYIDSCHVDTLESIICNNIGAMHHTLGNMDSALFYYNKTLSSLEHTKRFSDISRTHSLLGKFYLNKEGEGNIQKSKVHYDEALKNADLSGNYSLQFFAMLQLSDYYDKLKNRPLATSYAQMAYDLVNKNNGKIEEKIYATRALAQQLAMTENPKIMSLYSEFIGMRDSVFKTETASKIADYKVLYETEKKVNENKLLMQENNIKQITIQNRNRAIITLSIGLLLIAILIVWRLNVIKLKKKFVELENEKKLQKDRERISRDLHDNVGGQLSYVMFSLEGSEENTPEKRIEKSSHLANALRGVTSNLRETIWALNKEELNLHDIGDKLKLYAQNMFAYTDTKLKFEEHIITNTTLNPAIALNIFRICQEIINNVFKHAQATELTVLISQSDKIEIVITDNGIGFESESSTGDGFGLNNLKQRALEMKAVLNVHSELNKGTIVTLIV